jgi:hypothetical protein
MVDFSKHLKSNKMAKRKTLTSDEIARTPFEDLVEVTRMASFDPDQLEEEEVKESGAAFWKFVDNPEVIGLYLQPVIAREDKADQWAKGDTIGYLMQSARGQEFIVPANFAIIEVLTAAKKGDIFKITFLGKEKSAKGQFSRFRIVAMKQKAKEESKSK